MTFVDFSTAELPSGTLVTVYPTITVGLGSCSAFAVMAGTTLSFESALTIITTLSVGNSPGTVLTGNYRLEDGTTQIVTATANQCRKDLTSAHDAAMDYASAPLSRLGLGLGLGLGLEIKSRL
jgi:hypothetical protein